MTFASPTRPNEEMKNKKPTNEGRGRARVGLLVAICSWLLAGALLTGIASPAAAEHALSEVWSDSDGVEMKFSTDHDTLAEVSVKRESVAGAAPAASSQLEVDANPLDSGSRPDAAAEAQASSSKQQEADNVGVPAQSSQYAGHSRPEDDSSANSDSSDSESDEAGAKSANQHEQQQALSFRSASELVGDTPSTGGDANQGLEEQTSADAGADETIERRQQESNARFRSPGRLFKEALRMGGPWQSANSALRDESADSSSSQEAGSRANEADSAGAAMPDDASEPGDTHFFEAAGHQQRSDAKAQSQDSSLLLFAPEQRPRKFKTRLDGGEQIATKRSNSAFFQATETANKQESLYNKKQDDASEEANNAASNTNYNEIPPASVDSNSNEQSDANERLEENSSKMRPDQAPSSSSSEQDEQDNSWSSSSSSESDQAKKAGARQQQAMSSKQQAAAINPNHTALRQMATPKQMTIGKKPAGGNRPIDYDAVADFPRPGQQQQQTSRRQPQPLNYLRNVIPRNQIKDEARVAADSPDAIRDDFISPGHYPGSMAHLTQAASETKKKFEKEDSPAPATQSVTPEPMDKSESQQIMAPVLISTTTPMPMKTGTQKSSSQA